MFGFIPAGETGETTPGYFILTPLETSGGATVIVNRGFVPQELGDRSRRPDGLVSGEVTITGLMRAPQPRGLCTPADDPRKGIWFTRDPVTIAADLDLRRVAPFTIDADASPVPGRWPEGGHTVVSVPNNHLQYALTWFALALALLAVFVTFARGRIKPAQREDAS